MPTIGTRGNAAARGYGFTGAAAAEVLGGMVLMTPTSIASTGTGNSSSINANGSVTFSSCETLSLNGVFTSEYDNYMVVMRSQLATSSVAFNFRLRSSGTDASGSNYTLQYLAADANTVYGDRITSSTAGRIGNATSSQRSGYLLYVYGPCLAQPTATRSTDAVGQNDAFIVDYACTHSLSTQYDGISLYPTSSSITGLVSVYGLGG